ncbi:MULTISPECIES: CmcI family methyltransferase [Thiorhodovibrio]|uniref:CmcI family methyltransferase n=1 Tax=Thiorhodovibrio TaxID=61593 RepID=UPI00191128C7|nr:MULTISPECIES: CmcI family methyltransferase [Thiorhodovibrio]MBK5967476.1 hypothetical protein [Thiorhodovibrio winogradskyi]WPL14997.1 Rhamnosyl O-methyltransferase precursor [Thiorhodovibrio litoralis]
MADLSAWTPSEPVYLLDDLCRGYARASVNEVWFRQSWHGGVLTVDLNLRAEAPEVFATHPLGSRVRAALEGDAADPAIIASFAEHIATDPGPVLVFLDDDHNADHVQRELEGYAPLVGAGDWLIVADTVFADLHGTPVGQPTEKDPDVHHSNPRVDWSGFWPRTQSSSASKRPFPMGQGISPTGFCAVAGLGK